MPRVRILTLSLALSGAALLLPCGGAMADDAPGASNSGIGSSSGMIALNSLPDPPTTLATARVVDAKGTAVGAVQKVVMDPGGKPVTVDVALLGTGAVVAIDASKFNYDQGRNLLTAALDAREIAQEPRAPQG
jgi:hypothetical protein